ncbi:MAG: hypothetical protein GXO39_00630 [Thermotogae bacterium]|nr:hypothetical protein [Thermotogota bacterium]
MLLLFSYAYDVFNGDFSPWELEGYVFPNMRFYTSVFNYAAGSYGGIIGGSYSSYRLRSKFFTSGGMLQTDEKGNVVGSFSSNFVSLDGAHTLDFNGWRIAAGLSLRYVSLSPQSRGVALGVVANFQRTFKTDWGGWNFRGSIDGLGYELLPVGLRRTLTSFKAMGGADLSFQRLFAYVQGRYYYVGGKAYVLGLGLDYGTLRFGIGYNSHYAHLYGGYGRDRLAGTHFGFTLRYRRIVFSYVYNPLGLFGDRHILAVAYTLR